MKKISKSQEEVLLILAEGGVISEHIGQNGIELSLEDGDKNTYFIRADTFKILANRHKYIRESEIRPAMGVSFYFISGGGIEYLKKHRYEDVKQFISK